MKYKVGDKVRVRQWNDMEREFGLNSCGYINNPVAAFIDDMAMYCGEVVTISQVLKDSYCIKEHGYIWVDEMFEDTEEREGTKMKSKMKEVAKLLCLEWDDENRRSEHFTIDQYSKESKYCINEKGLTEIETGEINSTVLSLLITGEYTLRKLPWKPETGDRFYYVDIYGEINNNVFLNTNTYDVSMLKNGWLFRTKEEAESNKERVLKEIKEVLKK